MTLTAPRTPMTIFQKYAALVAGGLVMPILSLGALFLSAIFSAVVLMQRRAFIWNAAGGFRGSADSAFGATFLRLLLWVGAFIVLCGVMYLVGWAIMRAARINRAHAISGLGVVSSIVLWQVLVTTVNIITVAAAPLRPLVETVHNSIGFGTLMEVEGVIAAVMTVVGIGAASWLLIAHMLRARPSPQVASVPRT